MLSLSSCVSKPTYEPIADQGIVCRQLNKESTDDLKKQVCLSVDYDTNPVRFHRLTPWELDQLPPMPDTN